MAYLLYESVISKLKYQYKFFVNQIFGEGGRPMYLNVTQIQRKTLEALCHCSASVLPADLKSALRFVAIVFLIVVQANEAMAQTKSVSGVVTAAESGEALPGANVVIKGTTRGASTGVDGSFSIEASEGEVLVVSFLGYRRTEITVGKDTNLKIALTAETLSLSEVVVIGSHSNRARTNVERAVPVDVLSVRDLQSTGHTELAQMIHFQAPSFHSTKYGIVNVTAYIDPATLRGMGTDQTLVLINGKRRHQSAALNVNLVVGRGSVGTDLNAIPTAAIERVEILRDGAAAQYGSDAISGIVNIVLKQDGAGGAITQKLGTSSRGDGDLYETSVNYGTKINEKDGSYLNTTLVFHHHGETDRKDRYSGYVYIRGNAAADEAMIQQRGFDRDTDIGTKFGQSRNTMGTFFYNGAYPLGGDWEAYSFGGLSYKDLLSFGFYRQAGRADRSVPEIYPDGYSPLFPATSTDAQVSAGIKKTDVTGWNFDIGGTYGKNWLATYVEEGANASYGAFTPTEFFLGNNNFGHQTFGASASRTFEKPGSGQSFSLAFGAEARREEYQITVGDRVSYTHGPLITSKEFSSSGKVGFSPNEAVERDRTNVGVFVDAEADLSKAFLLGAAARFENYSDFGSNLSGKISARYKLADPFSLRGSVNRGFRAPSLQQLYFSANDPQFGKNAQGQDDAINILQIRNDDPILPTLGYGNLDAETSLDFSLGATLQLGRRFSFTADAYQVKVKDRIIISEQFDITKFPNLTYLFTTQNIRRVQFFTNAVDTKTQGLDLVAFYNKPLGANTFTATLAATFNKTKFDSGVRTSPQLVSAGITEVVGVNMRGLVEVAQPRNKFILSLAYDHSKFNANVRASRFGKIEDVDSKDAAGKFQVKKAKNVVDLSLGYKFTSKITFNVDANNVFDEFPDRNLYGGIFDGLSPYGRSTSQFGLLGRFYSTSLAFSF
jgi:iron complex outermembrane receptor protein